MRIVLLTILILTFVHSRGQTIESIALLNSPLDEQSPVLSPDGNTLFFTISNHPQNVAGKKDLGDIWYAQRSASGWGAPLYGGVLLNNALHNTVAGMAADGNQLFLMGHYDQNGRSVNSQGLAVSMKTGDTWSSPQNIVIPYFKNKSPFQSGYLSSDGNVLVFSADSYNTLGAEDIYVSLKSNGKWSEARNIGPSVNTTFQDVSPSLGPDGKRLFFATNGRQGFGSFDIYYADRLDDTWQRWSAPVNLGQEINSEGRELFYRSFQSGDFYTTTNNSDGYGDLKFRPARVEQPVQDSVLLDVVVNPITNKDTASGIKEIVYESPKDKGVLTRLYGKVINARTNNPIGNAVIQFLSTVKREVSSQPDGVYSATLPAVEEYHVKVEAPGFIGDFEKLDLRTRVMKDLEMNFTLHPIEVGATVNLRSVLFEQSKPNLLSESYDELDMVADFLMENPHIEIELAGHTDNRGKHDLNMKLSRERVGKVKEYLVSKGIEESRISGRGYGGTKPIADNDVDETRKLNRRVEFTIVKD